MVKGFKDGVNLNDGDKFPISSLFLTKIIKMVEEKVLQFTWKGPDQFESIMNNANELTTVNVSFESISPNTTKVVVEHLGFKEGENWIEAIQWHKMAWTGVLSSLKSSLEEGEGNLCCQPTK